MQYIAEAKVPRTLRYFYRFVSVLLVYAFLHKHCLGYTFGNRFFIHLNCDENFPY